MSKKKNRYKQEAKKRHFLSGMNEGLPTKGNTKNTVLETGKDILVGVLGGGLIGAIIGKPSLPVGIITTGVGHYTGNKLVQILGIGIMSASGFQKSGTVSGLEGMEGMKERLQAYKETLQEKFYLDKILKKVGEESAETIIAAKNDDDARLTAESADLLYHLIVLLVARGVSLTDIANELAQRRKG